MLCEKIKEDKEHKGAHGGAVALRCCATSRKVAGSIPDGVVGIFHSHNPSGRTKVLGSTQLVTELSTRNTSLAVKAAGA
jgi:hypothetical protein